MQSEMDLGIRVLAKKGKVVGKRRKEDRQMDYCWSLPGESRHDSGDYLYTLSFITFLLKKPR